MIGVGLSFFVEQGAHGTSVLAAWGRPIVPGYEQANVRLTADGEVEIHVGTHSHGQGHETTYAQVAHEILGVDFDKIKVLQGDTLYTPYSTSTWGSRSMVHGGGAVARASGILARRAAQIGAWLLQTDVANVRVADGKVIAGHSSVTLREVARAWYLQPQNLPPHVDTGGLDVTAGYRAERDSGTFTYATHAAVVAVDAATGLIEILDYVVVEDGGVLVNPMIVDGQICGGTAQGIGTCIYEAMPFDAQGQPLASTMLDYMLPGAAGGTGHPGAAYGDPFALHRIRHQGPRRRRCGRAARGHRLGRERRASAAQRRGARFTADARADSCLRSTLGRAFREPLIHA